MVIGKYNVKVFYDSIIYYVKVWEENEFPTLEEKSWNFYDLISAYSGRNTEPYSTRKNWKNIKWGNYVEI